MLHEFHPPQNGTIACDPWPFLARGFSLTTLTKHVAHLTAELHALHRHLAGPAGLLDAIAVVLQTGGSLAHTQGPSMGAMEQQEAWKQDL